MVSQVIKDSFLNLYRDDYRDSDNFYKILFNNGRGLQQRELNQLQTIINKDIQSFAGYILDQGAATDGGQITVSEIPFIKLDTVTSPLPADITSIENVIFEETVTGIQFRVVKVLAATGTSLAKIYVQYVDQAGTDNVGNSTVTVTNTSSSLVAQNGSGITLTSSNTDTASNPMTGFGLLAIQNPGRFYVDEHFIFAERQVIVLAENTTFGVDAVIGHLVTEDIVTVNDDQNLYDNSGVNLNLAAPGADRYRIRLTLTTQDLVDSSDYFIPQIKVEDGGIISNNSTNDTQLKATENFLALRLREIHGNFTTQNFIINFAEDENNNNNFKVLIGPGKAYVDGIRVFNQGQRTYTEAKPRSTSVVNNDTITVTYGNYVVVSNLEQMFDFTSNEKINLYTAASGGGTNIGTAHVRAIEEFGSNYKVYLFDIRTSTGNNFGSVKSIGNASGYSDIVLENGVCKLYQQTDRNLFFPLNRGRPKSFGDIVTTVQKLHTGTANGSGEIALTASTGRAFDDSGAWIVVNETTNTAVSPTISASGASATISGLTSGQSYSILAYEQHSGGAGNVKTKTLAAQTDSGLALTNGVATLTKVDAYRITSIIDDSTSADITDDFRFNNGQTESYYGYGTVTLKGGATAPATTITVTYDYFNWGVAGDFFAASSYTGAINYEDIPSFRQSNGERVELRDVLDFRPAASGSSYSGVALPRSGDLITMDTEYYLPQRGKIYASSSGVIGVRIGDPAFNPQFPDLSNDLGIMEIANFELNPYMLNASDLTLTYVQNKRYTMKDIANLDQRLEDLKETTSLSLLELSAVNKEVLDVDGLNRLKSGITADNFTDHYQTDVADEEHKAAIDFVEGVVRPRTTLNNIELVLDSDASIGVRKSGDLVTIDYDEVVWAEQEAASRAIPISEIVMNTYQGVMAMSPASDNWLDTERLPDKIITGNPRVSEVVGNTYKYHDVSYRGIPITDLATKQNGNIIATGRSTSSSSTTGGKTTSTSYGHAGGTMYVTSTSAKTTTTVTKTPQFKLEGSTVLMESLGDYLRARLSIPKMRSRFVSFKATGLRPNTRHFAFFDTKAVDDWVYTVGGVSEFNRISDLDRNSPFLDAGNIYKRATQYPLDGGPTEKIITDANGSVSGWFLIPNTDAINFPTGRLTFMLIDISERNTHYATSFATFQYEANGTLEQVQEEILSTRIYQIRQSVKVSQSSSVVPAKSTDVFVPPPPPPARPPQPRNFDSCFVKGTKVLMADGTSKNIEDVQIFDMVAGQNGANMVVSYDHWPLAGRDLIGINENGPFKTPEHPLMTREGWKAYDSERTKVEKPEIAYLMVNGNLVIGDEILMADGSWVKVESLEVHSNQPEQVVYNFYLDGDNTYYANNMLAHNRADAGGQAGDGGHDGGDK